MSFVKQSEPPQSCGACKGPSPLVPYKYKQREAIRRSYQSGAFIEQWTKAAARATDTKQPDEQVIAQFTFAIQEHTHAHTHTWPPPHLVIYCARHAGDLKAFAKSKGCLPCLR